MVAAQKALFDSSLKGADYRETAASWQFKLDVGTKMEELIEGEDFYWEGGFLVFTAKYHLRRGSCCGSGCRHCPYEPRWTKDVTEATDNQSGSRTFISVQKNL